MPEPNAMILSTSGSNGRPSSRVVLLKGLSDKGLVFYTNYNSRKASEIEGNPYATAVFYWRSMDRQVRIEGRIEQVPAEESDNYFAERPHDSQIGAWASPQSETIPGRKYLEERFREYEKKFMNQPVPRPPHWGGYRIVPDYFEFWQAGPGRLHDRLAFRKQEDAWELTRLAP